MKKPISEHFDDLGAPLRNVLNSWGAVRPDGVVIQRVWADRKQKVGAAWFRQLLHVSSEHKGGYLERMEHVERLRQGAKGFAVIVTAADPLATPRRIVEYNSGVLVPLGRLLDINGEVWGECLPPVPVADAFALPA